MESVWAMAVAFSSLSTVLVPRQRALLCKGRQPGSVQETARGLFPMEPSFHLGGLTEEMSIQEAVWDHAVPF